MPRQGLNKEMVVEEAVRLIEQAGDEQLSLRELAAKLNVKAASLYNHIDGIEEIRIGIGLKAIEMLNAALAGAVKGKDRDEALKAAAKAYRAFAKEHPSLYKAIIKVPMSGESILSKEWPYSLQPLLGTVGEYQITHEDMINFFRYLRSAMHGFLSLERAGFLKDKRVDIETSYEGMIAVHIEILHAMEQKNRQERGN